MGITGQDHAYNTPREVICRIGELREERGLSLPLLAELWGVHNIHLYKALDGDVSPTLERAMRRVGVIPPKPTRQRLHYEASYDRERIETVRAFLEENGYQNLTEFVDAQIARMTEPRPWTHWLREDDGA